MYKSLQEVVLKRLFVCGAFTVCLQKLLLQMHDGLVVKTVASQQSWFQVKRPDLFFCGVCMFSTFAFVCSVSSCVRTRHC